MTVRAEAIEGAGSGAATGPVFLINSAKSTSEDFRSTRASRACGAFGRSFDPAGAVGGRVKALKVLADLAEVAAGLMGFEFRPFNFVRDEE